MRALLLAAILVLGTGCGGDQARNVPVVAYRPLVAWTWSPPSPGAVGVHGLMPIDITRDDPLVMAVRSRDLPPGLAAILLRGERVLGHPDDRVRAPDGCLTAFASPWMVAGEAGLLQRMRGFFARYHEAGGRLDYLVVDNEDGLSMWGLPKPHLTAILADPRAAPLIAELGFANANTLDDHAAPAYVLGGNPDETGAADKPYMAWNRVLGRMLVEALNRSICAPVLALYPACRINNYDSFRTLNSQPVIDVNGHLVRSSALFGNRACAQFYGYNGFQKRLRADQKAYGDEPFAILRYLLNNQRAVAAANPEPLTPWVGYYRWTGDRAYPSTLGGTPCWVELLYHLTLAGADDLLVFNPQPWKASQDAMALAQEADDLLLEGILAEINRRIGGRRRTPLTGGRIAWDADLLATGCRLDDDRILWRITVPRWADKVRVQPGGQVLSTGTRQGLWYESRPGEQVVFSLVASR
jgi:hypothetical protein